MGSYIDLKKSSPEDPCFLKNYTDLRKISKSQNHSIYRARSLESHTDVIIKALEINAQTVELVSLLRHEYELLSTLRIPGVLRVYDFCSSSKLVALVLEDAGQQSLDEWVNERDLPVDTFLHFAIQMTEIVERLHEKRHLHRRLDLSRFIMGAKGELTLVGFSTAINLNKGTGDTKSPVLDLRALGRAFYTMIRGGPKPAILQKIIDKLFEESIERSYRSATSLKHDLLRCRNLWHSEFKIDEFILGTYDYLDPDPIAQSSNFLSSLVENIPDMIFVKDAKDLKFVGFNRAGEELLGFAREDLIGKNDYDFFPKAEADHFVSKDRLVLAGFSMVDIPEEIIHTRHQGERVLHTKKIPVFDSSGKAQFLLGISEDITEKKKAELVGKKLKQEQAARFEAEKLLQARDVFLAIASHELRTPLTSLKMHLQLFRRYLTDIKVEQVPALPLFLKTLTNSDQQFSRISKLIDDLLEVSRISAGRFELNINRVDLSNVVNEVLDRFQVDLDKAKCSLSRNIAPELSGYFDAARVEQVVVNLLTNAMKYGAENTIEVTLEKTPGKAKLSVRDHGIGIAAENRSRIFERFERAVSVRQFSGLGLGLFITREIVSAHHGQIWVESEVGQGSCFFIEMPLNES